MNSRAKTWAVKNAPTKNETTIKPADMSTSINLTKKPWTKTDVNNSKSKSRDRISLSSTRTRAKGQAQEQAGLQEREQVYLQGLQEQAKQPCFRTSSSKRWRTSPIARYTPGPPTPQTSLLSDVSRCRDSCPQQPAFRLKQTTACLREPVAGAHHTGITPPAAVPTSRDRMGLGRCDIRGPRGGVVLYIYESGAVWPRFFQTPWLGLKRPHEWSFVGLRVGLILVRP
jgi:hypothetical protein